MTRTDHVAGKTGPITAINPRRVRVGSIHWIVRQAEVPSWLREILCNPDTCLQACGAFVADSRLITLAKFQPHDPHVPAMALRRLNYGLALHRWRELLRRTRAERGFWHGLALERAGVSTPRPWAAGVERSCRWPLRAYLVTEWVDGAVTLEQLLKDRKQLSGAEVRDLACLLARMHDAGFSHRDLKASNVVFDRQHQPFLIDLDGVRRVGLAIQGRAVADLARFAWEFAKYPTCLKWAGARFLNYYCRQRKLAEDRTARRRLAQKILHPTMLRLAAGSKHWKK